MEQEQIMAILRTGLLIGTCIVAFGLYIAVQNI